MKLTILLLLTAAFAHAGVILNAPDANSGFFDGMSDYYNYDGTGKIGNVLSSSLPPSNGLTSQKVYGSASLSAFGTTDPYIVAVAFGTASGSFDVDTQIALQFNFSVDSDAADGVYYYLNGEIKTSAGYYSVQYSDSTKYRTSGATDYLGKNGITYDIPAGAEVESWFLILAVGDYGHQNYISNMTVNIPANSLEFVASATGGSEPVPTVPTGPGSDVPEPSALALTAAGIALLIGSRLRHAG